VYVDGERVPVRWEEDGKTAEVRVRQGPRRVVVKKDGATLFDEELTLGKDRRRVVVASPGAAPVAPAPLAKEITNSVGMRLNLIPAGKFVMGSPKDEQVQKTFTYLAEKPQHEVEISKDFYLGVYEVTQGEWKKVIGANPSRSTVGDDFPVDSVNDVDALKFIAKLNELEKQTLGGWLYALPTEAQWEYACRGGSPTYQKYHFGDGIWPRNANYGGSGGRTHKVGSCPPNTFGLYDMHGNVAEWCADYYDTTYYARSPKTDPLCLEGAHRVTRGGSWGNAAKDCRSASRSSTNHGGPTQGFRVARIQAR
jgi:formylglycine-generating enzyme required for sulfatase activity